VNQNSHCSVQETKGASEAPFLSAAKTLNQVQIKGFENTEQYVGTKIAFDKPKSNSENILLDESFIGLSS